ncbi:hypothetical protein [Trichormus variabilis]|nr:hypothetical protein [Trichormus variabilis]MBD2628002.1 hypothetical protein [Trichormus variabilis FACHB-164]
MTQKLISDDFSELDLLQTIEPKGIVDESMRHTVEVLLNLIEQLQSKVKGLESVNQLTSDLLEHFQLPIKCKNALNPFGCSWMPK